MTITDKMNEFVPGIVPGQQEFLHVAPDGTVARWWLTPGTFGPTSHNPSVTDHPLGAHPRLGWHDASGNPIPTDPRRRLHLEDSHIGLVLIQDRKRR